MQTLYRLVAPVPAEKLERDLKELGGFLLGPRPLFYKLSEDPSALDAPESLRSYSEAVFGDHDAALGALDHRAEFVSPAGEQPFIESITCYQGCLGNLLPEVCPGIADFPSLDGCPPRDVQWYLDGKERGGIDADLAWERRGGHGESVDVVILDETFDPNHRDLTDCIGFAWGAPKESCGGCHGTQALGLMAGTGSATGLSGLAPRSCFSLAPLSCTVDELVSPENALHNLRTLAPGSVVLVEREIRKWDGKDYSPWLPVEAWPPAWRTLKQLTDRGIHVVQAAGNGITDLDRSLARVCDSGSILVGAGCPFDAGRRIVDSNFGRRVHVHAWGDRVVTTDGGSGCHPANDRKYFADFGGTSAASAIVAGMVASLSGIWKARFPSGPALAPADMRRIVASSTWGSSASGIGPRANFREALEALDRLAAQVTASALPAGP